MIIIVIIIIVTIIMIVKTVTVTMIVITIGRVLWGEEVVGGAMMLNVSDARAGECDSKLSAGPPGTQEEDRA